MATLRIDLADLSTALTDQESTWVLDLQTGEVLMAEWVRDPEFRGTAGLVLDEDPASGEDLDDEDWGDFDPLESGRFRRIDPLPSHESFRWMEQFVEGQQDDRVREHLLGALNRSRPFRRFKDALMDFPAVREAWFQYEEARLREEAETWVRAEEIDAELMDLRAPDAPET